MPFGKEELEYIARLDVKKDIELLRRELPSIREESLRTLEVATTLLKKCAAAGMSLSEIANVVTRPLIGEQRPPRLCQGLHARVAVLGGSADGSMAAIYMGPWGRWLAAILRRAEGLGINQGASADLGGFEVCRAG